MKKFLLGSLALIALGMSAPALAADMPVKVKAPPPVVVYDWSGAYVGFSIGGVWTEVEPPLSELGSARASRRTISPKAMT